MVPIKNEEARLLTRDSGIWLSCLGVPTQLLVHEREPNGGLSLSRLCLDESRRTITISYKGFLGYYVTAGSVSVVGSEQPSTLRSGEFVSIAPGLSHAFASEGGPAEILMFGAPSGIDAFQLAVGEIATGEEGPFPSPTEDAIRIAHEVAEKFGVSFHGNDSPSSTVDVTVVRQDEVAAFAAAGDVYRFLISGEDTEGSYALWHGIVYPGGGPPPHLHTREDELIHVLNGELCVYDDGIKYTAGAGETIPLPKENRHWFKNESDSPAEILVAAAPAGFEQMLMAIGQPWDSANERPPLPDAEERSLLAALAPDYGVLLG